MAMKLINYMIETLGGGSSPPEKFILHQLVKNCGKFPVF